MHDDQEFKVLIYRLKYLRMNHEMCSSIFQKARSSFFDTLLRIHKDINVYDSEIDSMTSQSHNNKSFNNSDHTNDQSDNCDVRPKNKSDAPKWAKRLYREIAKATHPDKLSDDLSEDVVLKKRESYAKSMNAYQEGNFSDLIEIACDMEIPIGDVSVDHISEIEKRCSIIENEICEIKSSSFWVWFHSTDDKKHKIMSDLIASKGWAARESMRTRSRKGAGNHPGKSIKWIRKNIIES